MLRNRAVERPTGWQNSINSDVEAVILVEGCVKFTVYPV